MKFEPFLPIYENIKRHIRSQIESGLLKPGDRIPSELQLAQQSDVSRGQTRQALRDLEMERLIIRSPGRGSFVAPGADRKLKRRATDMRSVIIAYPIAPSASYPTPGAYSYYSNTMMDSLSRHFGQLGFHAMFTYMNFGDQSETRFLDNVDTLGVEGLALYLMRRTRNECERVRALLDSGFPVVLYDRFLRGFGADFVGTDNAGAYRRLTNILIDRGHTCIAYLARDHNDTVMEERHRGYREALDEHGIPRHPGLEIEAGDLWAGKPGKSKEIVKALLAHRPAPSAFVTSEDVTAHYLTEALEACEIHVPEDVEIATMDDREPAAWQQAPWTIAVQDGFEIGRQVAELLVSRIEYPGAEPESRFVSARFVEDESSTPARWALRNERGD
jgi:GntR family transcriptional regulator, arabinose operon transcriptional repressor